MTANMNLFKILSIVKTIIYKAIHMIIFELYVSIYTHIRMNTEP